MDKVKRFFNTDRIVAIVWLIIAGYVWWEATTYPVSLLDAVGPAKYPHLLSALIAIGAVGLFVTGKPKEKKEGKAEIRDFRSFFYVILALVVYLTLFNITGFAIATVIFLLAMCLYFDDRDWKTRLKGAIPFSIGFTIVIYLFFAEALGVQLPTLFL